MGMANYVSRFVPNLSAMMQPLRQLTSRHVQWWWGPEHEQAIQNVKKAITSVPVLQYFDRTKTPIVQADASEKGL